MADANVDFTRMQTRLALGGSEGGSASVVLDTGTTQVGTDADTAEKTLYSYAMPANMLSADGRMVRIYAAGTLGANANAKTIRLKFGSAVLQIYSAGTGNALTWIVDAIVIRTGAATQKGFANLNVGATFTNAVFASPTETLSGAVTIALTGQNGTASANDIVFEMALVELLN